MANGKERRAARAAEREARRLARAAARESRQANRLARQEQRQGFLGGIIGEGGLQGLVETAGDSFGGGGGTDLPPPTKQGEGGDTSMDMQKMLPLIIGAGALIFLMKKK